jgi:diketogulonate reductase-like aldo/keto reductase
LRNIFFSTKRNIPDLPILLENQTIKRIASKYNKTPAQICLRWGVQRNLVVLPKSITNKRILENAQVIFLSKQHFTIFFLNLYVKFF